MPPVTGQIMVNRYWAPVCHFDTEHDIVSSVFEKKNKAFVGHGSCDNVQTERSSIDYANWFEYANWSV